MAGGIGEGSHPKAPWPVLELVGLADAGRRRIGGYSLGMRPRLGIAGTLLADPPVLVFDEPANGLDPEGIRWMRDLCAVTRRAAARCCCPRTCSTRSSTPPTGHPVEPSPDGSLVISGAEPSPVFAVAAAGGHVLTELRPTERGLEELFFQLTTAS